MARHESLRRLLDRLRRLAVVSLATLAMAGSCTAGPALSWQASGATSGIFSRDGTTMLLSTSTGFELRRASDGALVSRLTLPTGSRAYDTRALSPDEQTVALSIFDNGVARIELWHLADGTLLRTLTTDATTNIRALDFSTTGLLASEQRFAYQQGGLLRVFRISDGALLQTQGPLMRNENTRVKFSPDARYLAVHDNVAASGIRILRTSDWATVSTIGDFSEIFEWYPDSSSLWVSGGATQSPSYQLVQVSTGNILRTTPWTAAGFFPTAVTADGRFFLACQSVTTDPGSPPGDTIEFVRASDSVAQVSYRFGSTIAYSGAIDPDGTRFGYGICPPNGGSCTFYVAQMPAL